MRKEISILISAVFIITLISSTPVQSVRVSGTENQDFLYSVSVSPTFVRFQQGEFGTFDVKVQRGSDAGPFFVDLSLTADSSLPRGAVTFNPPTLNFEQGQPAANSTMKINSHGLDTGSFRFRVGAATHTPVGSDQAVSNTAALIVSAQEAKELSNSLTDSAPTDASPAQTEENRVPIQPNHAPIAKAGQGQTISEGERVTLDGSSSTDPDKDALSFSWEQLVPRQPTIKLVTSEASGKASFIAPDVDRDTVFRFNLIVQDGNGGQAIDSVNVLVKNVADVAQSPATSIPNAEQQEQQEQQQQQNEVPSSQAGETSSDSAAAAGTENHSPTAETMQTILVTDANPLSVSLKGSDPDKGDSISYEMVTNPSQGSIAGFDKATGSLTYVPTSGFIGQDRLSFKVVDSHGAESNVGLVVLRASTAVGPGSSSPSSTESTSTDSSSPSLPPPKANENSTQSTTPVSNVSAVTTGGPSATEGAELAKGNNSSANKPGENQTVAAANQTGSENQTLASNVSSFAASALAVGEQYYFHLNWGKFGTQNGNFSNPHDIAIDKDGNVFVLDNGNNRVQKFDKTGNFIPTAFPTTFNSPQGIAVDNAPGQGNGEVYVVDTGNSLVKRFSNTGVLIKSWGGPSGSGPFNTPIDATIDSSHNVYVSDANNHRIVKTDNNGGFILKFGATGNAAGKVQGPHAMGVDSKDFIYVVDSSNNKRVVKYTKDGVWSGTNIVGCESGTFSAPHGIAIDSGDKLFVTDRGANKVCKFNDQGGFLASFGNPLTDPATNFNGPDGIATSTDSILQVYVVDSGNNRVEVFSNVPPPSITINLDNLSPKWGFVVTATVDVTSAQQSDKISISWGDGTPDTVITPISVDAQGNAQVTTTHIYAASAILTNPNKVAGKLLTSQGAEKAKTPLPDKEVAVQKHSTSVELGLRTPPTGVDEACTSCDLVAFGKLVDTDAQNAEIGGKTIEFSGTGATTLNSQQTGGLTFFGDSNNNVTLGDGKLRMHVGSRVSLPGSPTGITVLFASASGSEIGLTLTKANGTTHIADEFDFVGTPFNAEFGGGFKEVTITSIDGSSSPSGYADLKSISTRYLLFDPEEQYQVDFSSSGQPAVEYSTLVTNPGSYFTKGTTPESDATGLTVTAQFDGTSDPAYVGSTASVGYDVSVSAGNGLADATPDEVIVWTKLNVGGSDPLTDVCSYNGVLPANADADKDGICDAWEDQNTLGNTLTERYVTCPSKSAHATLDPQCPTAGVDPRGTSGKKFNLCIQDQFASAPEGSTKSAGATICPKPGHKDIYVEIDYKSTHVPSDTAIANVIKAFSNAPVSNSAADDFARSGGITLHVVKDNSIGTVGGFAFPDNLFAWKDPGVGSDNNNNNDFFNVKKNHFGTSTERDGTSTKLKNINTAALWTSTGKTLKHYMYHYGLWVNFYSKTVGLTCPALGTSSGLGETLGNDFIVSLGCGWGAFDGSARSIAQQSGTFMHEIGHNLNLGHGGPSTPILNQRTATDYDMNCKVNYLSVMNYARQVPYDLTGALGIDTGDLAVWEAKRTGSTAYNYGQDAAQFMTMLDYARTALPTQNEAALNEQAGTAPPDGKKYKIIYLKTNGPTVSVKDAGANFDFTGEGSIGTPAGDVNSIATKILGCGPKAETEKSYNDWNEIKLVFLQDPDSQDGVTQAVSQPFTSANGKEVTAAYAETLADNAEQRYEFIPPPNTDGSSVFNKGSNIPLKFRIFDRDGNIVTNAVVTLKATHAGLPDIVQPFVFDPNGQIYASQLKLPKGATATGVWQVFYYIDYQTPNQILVQTPEASTAHALYTNTFRVS